MNSKEEIRLKKIDIHLHLTLQQYPKTDTMFLSSAAQMLPHLEELGIEDGDTVKIYGHQFDYYK